MHKNYIPILKSKEILGKPLFFPKHFYHLPRKEPSWWGKSNFIQVNTFRSHMILTLLTINLPEPTKDATPNHSAPCIACILEVATVCKWSLHVGMSMLPIPAFSFVESADSNLVVALIKTMYGNWHISGFLDEVDVAMNLSKNCGA